MSGKNRDLIDPGEVEIKYEDCEIHGPYLSFVTASSTSGCAVCLFNGQDGIHYLARYKGLHEQETSQDHIEALRVAGVPERYLDCRFANFWPESDDQVMALREAEAYAANFGVAISDGKNLLFLGGAGTGKTHLAVAILSQLIVRGQRVRYVDARKRIGFGVGMNPADLVVIDNVGHAQHQNHIAPIQGLLMDRYDAALPTIVVSSLGRNAIESALDRHCLDRLSEGGSKVVRFNWESYRRANRTKQLRT